MNTFVDLIFAVVIIGMTACNYSKEDGSRESLLLFLITISLVAAITGGWFQIPLLFMDLASNANGYRILQEYLGGN